MDVVHRTLFGCSLQELNAQFGLNQNPTVYTVTVVREAAQKFELESLKRHGVRSMAHISLGALDFWGIVQSWDEQKINIGGTGVFVVRMTDLRPAMDSVQVLLGAPVGVSLGENIVAVTPETNEDLVSGIKFTMIRSAVQAATFRYGNISFQVNLDQIKVISRVIDGEIVPYRVSGGAMSLVELIQQLAEDHCMEWYVETAPNNGGGYTVTVKVLDRGVSTLDLDGLSVAHAGKVIRLAKGHENRDDVTRTVLVGAQKQILSEEPGKNWRPFWGFNEEGSLLDGPEFKIVDREGREVRRKTTYQEMEMALNGELVGRSADQIAILQAQGATVPNLMTPAEIDALKSYAEEFWGRQFYSTLNPKIVDGHGEPWIEATSAGWWGESGNPAKLPIEGEQKFATDDGRWTSFVKLKDPGEVGSVYDNSVILSDSVVNAKAGRFIKCSIERVELHRGNIAPNVTKRQSIWLMQLASPLVVRTTRTGPAQRQGLLADAKTGYMITTWTTGGNQFLSVQSPIPDTTPQGELPIDSPTGSAGDDGFTGDYPDPPTQGWAGLLSGNDDASTDSGSLRQTRMVSVDKVFMATLDKRTTYGPWTSDKIIPPLRRLPGKTRVVVDTSLAPWTYGYRGIENADATRNMDAVALARLKVYTHTFDEIDTGDLEVADLPAANLGTTIGHGTNITSISVAYDIRGIRTQYKCNLFTNELGRYQRYYQDLVDKLRRDAQRHQNTVYPQSNYLVLDRELRKVKKDLLINPNPRADASNRQDDGECLGKIVGRSADGPYYTCERYKWQENALGRVVMTPAAVGSVTVTNLAEPSDQEGRVPVGTLVTIRRYSSNGVMSAKAWVMDVAPPAPQPITATVDANLGNNGSAPTYAVTPQAGDTGALRESEIAMLKAGVPNLGEVATSKGNIQKGAPVMVTWVYDAASQGYKPQIEKALNIFTTPEVA